MTGLTTRQRQRVSSTTENRSTSRRDCSSVNTVTRILVLGWLLSALVACSVPRPYEPPPQQPAPSPGGTPTETQPAPTAPPVEEPTPLPPVVREPTLGAASRALVTQAQTQAASKNYAVAAASVERALRIEPDNPLLWIELGKVRQAEGNYQQAENMGRKAESMAANAPRTQAAAWSLIAESLRARGKNTQAREAEMRAQR
jgi:Flp pilus assembly protein TadD